MLRVDVERLTKVLEAVVTVGIGALAPAIITAITSWFNRDTARTQLEMERLKRQDDEAP